MNYSNTPTFILLTFFIVTFLNAQNNSNFGSYDYLSDTNSLKTKQLKTSFLKKTYLKDYWWSNTTWTAKVIHDRFYSKKSTLIPPNSNFDTIEIKIIFIDNNTLQQYFRYVGEEEYKDLGTLSFEVAVLTGKIYFDTINDNYCNGTFFKEKRSLKIETGTSDQCLVCIDHPGCEFKQQI